MALETPVLSGRVDDVGIIVETGGANPIRIAANAVVNASGLGSHAFARSIISHQIFGDLGEAGEVVRQAVLRRSQRRARTNCDDSVTPVRSFRL
jgi:hypothetical protein